MKEYIQEVLVRIETRKKAKGIVPSHTTSREFKEELKADLEQATLALAEEGKIMMGQTINDDYMIRT